MRSAELEARLRQAVRRWKDGADSHDVNALVAELKAELADLVDDPRRPPADATRRPH